MIVEQAFLAALEPPPTMTVSQWADARRMLSPEASAEPGRWYTARAPYQRAIMDAVNDPLVETVVVMSSAQVGKTEILCNIVGYTVDLDPGPALLIQPTLEMAEAFSKDRLDPMFRDTPCLRSKISSGRRDASNTIRHKAFPGGQLTLAGSNSTAGLASRPIRTILGDEVDRWDVTEEGDPLALVRKRTTTFWNRKHIWVSTPTIKGLSRIESQFGESDRRHCYVPCPHCGEFQILEWKNVRWDANAPETAHLVCPHCGCEIDEPGRAKMLRTPEWRATVPFRGIAGFHIWEAYSPWRRLADIVADFLAAKDSPDTLQVFVNTSLGESWEEKGEEAEAHVLLARREIYPAQVPAGACCLTMGVDVQDDRIEALIIGWGPGEESWMVAHHILPGDPSRLEPWQALDELLGATYQHETGAQLPISATCVDTGGHRTSYSYDYVSTHQHQRVFAIKGRAGAGESIVSAPHQKRSGRDPRKVPLYMVGVDQCKALLYSRLKVTAKGAGFVHLPMPSPNPQDASAGVDEEFVAQLTAERLVTRHKAGVPTRIWIQMRPRNEVLDMTVYAIAALRLFHSSGGPSLMVLASRLANPDAPTPTTPRPAREPWLPRRQGGWLKGSR